MQKLKLKTEFLLSSGQQTQTWLTPERCFSVMVVKNQKFVFFVFVFCAAWSKDHLSQYCRKMDKIWSNSEITVFHYFKMAEKQSYIK